MRIKQDRQTQYCTKNQKEDNDIPQTTETDAHKTKMIDYRCRENQETSKAKSEYWKPKKGYVLFLAQ